MASLLLCLAAAVALADVAGLFGTSIPAWLADRDFANYWIAGKLVLAGETNQLFSSHEVYFPHMQAAFGADYPWHTWSYPPHYLFFVWPLGLYGYAAAMVVFLAATLAVYLVAARAFAGWLDRQGTMLLVPFILFNILVAQNGFLSGAFMLGALAFRYERPVMAGIFAGLLTVKPQLGILLPVLFLIEGRWLTIVSAAVTTVVLVALSALVFGVDSWTGYIEHTFPYQGEVMNYATGVFLDMMPSVFGSLRNLGVDPGTALLVHMAIALPLLAATVYALLRIRDIDRRSVVVVVATFVLTPYALAYDLGPVAAALVLVSRWHSDRVPGALVSMAALLPMAMVPLGLASLPIAPLVLAALLLLLVGPAMRVDRQAPAAP